MNTGIVIIDNDDRVRDLFALWLRRDNLRVYGYTYAQIDLEMLKEHTLSLIILDFNLDDSNIGWEFLQMLKMDDDFANIPILITTTAFQLSAEIRSYLTTRYISIINKPFDLDILRVLIQKIIGLSSQSQIIFSSTQNLPILVVDDSDELREAITALLTIEGYQVADAYNGLMALNAVSTERHCLILLDIAMPVMSGLEFLRAYDRQLRPHSPVIIITGETDLSSHSLPSFVVDIIPKPFEVVQLLGLVEQYAHRM